MSSQNPETNPAALATRAAQELASGAYQAAQTAALVAIAAALAAKSAPDEKSEKPQTVAIVFQISSGKPLSVHVDAQAAQRAIDGIPGVGFSEWRVLP